ncbi:MAG: DUF5719 family protein [Mycobacterium sp.]
MTSSRNFLRIGARTGFGVLATTAVVSFVVLAVMVPLPEVRVAAPSTQVTPQPEVQQRVCPGPLLAITTGQADAIAVSPFGEPNVVAGMEDPDRAFESTALVGVDPAGSGSPTMVSVVVDPAETTVPRLTASQSQSVSGDEFTGLAAAGCQEAVAESRLVAGSTDVGRTTLIILNNPSPVAATVEIQIAGALGPVEVTGATGLIVEPGSQRVIPLAGLAPDVESPVVHVTSRGGQIAAWLQHSVVRGLVPGGIELTGHAASPSGRQVIPGVRVVAGATGVSNDTGRTLNDAEPVLRVHSVGEGDAELQVHVLNEDPAGTGAALSARVTGGAVADLPIAELGAGTYTVVIDSSAPVVAAVRGNTSGTQDLDFAWFQASEQLTESFLVSVPAGPSPRLHLANRGEQAAEVSLTPIRTAGDASTRTVEAGGSASLAVAAGGLYLVTGPAGLYAAVGFNGDGEVSSFPVSAISSLAAPITVYRG